MEVIVCHVNADFDALASLVAAKKVYPRARAVLGGGVDRNVKEFMTLHRNLLPVSSSAGLDLKAVHRVIVVDTPCARRLGRLSEVALKRDVEVHLYDHHPKWELDIAYSQGCVEEVGATTTLLLRTLRQRRLPVSPQEATLYALGIYEDTGSLTFAGTTAEDVDAVAFLLRQGADLDVVAAFIGRGLAPDQRELLNQLMTRTQTHRIDGLRIAIATGETADHVHELALLTHKICDVETADAVLAVVRMRDTVFVVARSLTGAVDVDALLRPLGGGGHQRAASAAIPGGTAEQIVAGLLERLQELPRRGPVAADIMSTPVRTVPPDVSMDEARRIMLRHGHSGLVVTDDGLVAGILSRTDLDKALHHGLAHAPVSGYMQRRVVRAGPQMSVAELERVMIENDVGRLPILDGDRLVGIVTRSDLMRARYGEERVGHIRTYRPGGRPPENVADRMARVLAPAVLDALRLVGERAHSMQLPAFLVGGCVRDLLLEEPISDVDVLIEGDAIAFAHSLSDELLRIHEHQRFGTAKITLRDGLHVDLASARREFYEHPAALPEVEHSTVREDLYRRDFTINAMAVSLGPDDFGLLVDFFGGQRDLEEGRIRVLHSLSFVEDPTRVLRAIRLEKRLRFRMEPVTESLVRRGATAEAFGRLSGQRFREELIALLEDRAPVEAFRRIAELGVLRLVHPGLELDERTLALMERCWRVFDWQRALPNPPLSDRWPCLLAPVVAELSHGQGRNLVQRLRLPAKQARSLLLSAELAPELEATLSNAALRPSQICALLEPLPALAGVFVLARTQDPVVTAAAALYFQELRAVRADVDGRRLIEAGYRPGRGFTKALAAARAAKMDGAASTPEEQLAVAGKVLEEC